jgi:SAM-dependent methyltransferase
MNEEAEKLAFTGERFTPECVREIWYEHWHRYAFALDLAKGRRVLDAACGEGYGSHLLATVASSVHGVDISAQAIEHARTRYGGADGITFSVGDAAALDLPDRSFDVVVSFETLEHLAAQNELIAGFARVLAEDGVLLISSPDKRTYSDIAGFRNEFHVRELYRDELLELLQPHFRQVRLFGQKLMFQSVLWAQEGGLRGVEAQTAAADGSISSGLDYAPLYYLAVCSNQELPATLPAISMFGDREESVYSHYNGEVRKNMSAGERIAELEAEVDRLRNSIPNKTSSRWPSWLRR